MKYRINTLIFFMFFLLSVNTLAGEKGEIRLSDGSVLSGKIISANNGLYVIKTESMGTIKIKKSKITSISFGSIDNDSFPSSVKSQINAENNDIKAKTSDLTKIMGNNEETMSSIMSLQDHPDFKAVLNDPKLIEAMNSGNISQLLSNPKIQKLMNNPTVKEISRQLPK